ncbi:restriction endonuclease [Sphingomonas sp. S-NIH.Pt15_0812]|uniref:restriction endonuclease n=1 Tax=Sphingomonas sp. S-NIH.Pt15_0812 TaxID=1920129 RepID=UPI000F7FA8AB|nr:restriction endonuclease [Sphingomonas sp. S-NIH.Pt15_0812]RSU47347.1 hypothetical protein BRX43_14050 [Sphingomonas sp. S-NIH.Pt15_0812]
MTKASDEFEQLNTRIYELISEAGASVEWNAQISDPDSPTELRQIDVLITTPDGRRISVECRDRDKPQTVMWIEELAGRKLSMGLDGMIAVARKGFTSLAAKKAKRFGIALYDLIALSDDEIRSWSGSAEVSASFIVFDQLSIVAALPMAIAQSLPPEAAFSRNGADGLGAVMVDVRETLKDVPFPWSKTLTLNLKDYVIGGHQPLMIACAVNAHLVQMSATCDTVLMHDHPGKPSLLRDTSIQRFDHSVRELISNGNDLYLQIAVDNIQQPENSILHEINVHAPTVSNLKKYELVGDRMLKAAVTSIDFVVTGV